MIEIEKSGDYGAAIRGDEKTAAWAATEPGVAIPTTSRDVSDGGMNKVAVGFGSVVIIALVLLCLRLAFDGVRDGAAKKGFTTPKYGTGAPETWGRLSPQAPVRAPGVTAPAVAAPLTILPVPPPPTPAVATAKVVWASESERERVLELTGDFRAAYETGGELSREWFTAVGALPVQNATSAIGVSEKRQLDAIRVTESVAPRFLTAKERETINTQIEGLTVAAGLATQPGRYPVALQETATEAGRELRTFLETVRGALSETDPAERNAAQARAETHRARAGALITSLESSVRGGTVAEPGIGR